MKIFLIVITLVYLAILVRTFRMILLEKGSPSRTLAWFSFLLLVPVFSIILYFIFGRSIRNKNMFLAKRNENEALFRAFDQFESTQYTEGKKNQPIYRKRFKKLIQLVKKNHQTVLTNGNVTELFHDGQSFFKRMFDDLNAAQQYIEIEFYIIEEGRLANELIDILSRKVKEGVEVKIIYDGIGSRDMSSEALNRIRENGIRIFGFLPPGRIYSWRQLNFRNHRKIIVIDGKVGYTGGFNIADKYRDGDPVLGFWRDTHVRISGPAVIGLHLVFGLDWHFVSGELVEISTPPVVSQTQNGVPVQIIASGPDSDIANIQQEYFSIINLAKKYVYIATPYFIPDQSIMNALKTAALSDIDVRLLVPNDSDSKLLKWSIRSFIEELLEVGVKVYFYQKGFMHGKVIIADDMVSSIGSANVDERSFSQNFEINAIIYGAKVCHELKTQFVLDMEKSQEIVLGEFKNRRRKERVMESVARLFSPLI